MTLEETITQFQQYAHESREYECKNMAKDFEQIANWLIELRERRDNQWHEQS